MAIEALINELKAASEGSDRLDAMMAILTGWRRRMEYIRENEVEGPNRKVIWISPDGRDYDNLPSFTTSLDDAFSSARNVAGNEYLGFVWRDNRGYAVIGDCPHSDAATPALALCVAVVRAKQRAPDHE
ncbi:hypothetical protein IB277_37440 [Ensifer sp. ENS07]|uniref:hypothetical protein n=1 Tax=Ensifer sp. ENS07 TaxID=2769274 RepID=UPI00177E9646|nr:hypothetical protein [Ensifer sp. ENS07]MBD9641950.1 hypothetical protein [Ensifer sp. ENS07]